VASETVKSTKARTAAAAAAKTPRDADAATEAPPCAGPDFSPRAPKLGLPRNACDAHAHIMGPAARHPYSPARVYTPPDCLLPDYLHLLDTLGVARAVLVQPSVYGTDNTVMLEAMKTAGGRLRGVAVVADDISDGELKDLDAAGVRGAYESALLGTPMAKPEQPVEILRTIHSFDPCLACATHVMSPEGEELVSVKVR